MENIACVLQKKGSYANSVCSCKMTCCNKHWKKKKGISKIQGSYNSTCGRNKQRLQLRSHYMKSHKMNLFSLNLNYHSVCPNSISDSLCTLASIGHTMESNVLINTRRQGAKWRRLECSLLMSHLGQSEKINYNSQCEVCPTT